MLYSLSVDSIPPSSFIQVIIGLTKIKEGVPKVAGTPILYLEIQGFTKRLLFLVIHFIAKGGRFPDLHRTCWPLRWPQDVAAFSRGSLNYRLLISQARLRGLRLVLFPLESPPFANHFMSKSEHFLQKHSRIKKKILFFEIMKSPQQHNQKESFLMYLGHSFLLLLLFL